MKRLTILTIICAGFACMTASGTVIHIPGDYQTIQEGIDSCAIHDTVLVAEGIYFENISIYLPISLIGEDRDSTIIDGSGAGDVIYIDAWGVLIRGFTIKNSGSNYEDAGVELSFTDSCAIECCNFEDNYAGLCLYGSSHNLIARSRFSGNARGIHFREDPDMTAPDNFRNAIQNNIIENQDLIAILFEHTYMTFHNSNVIIGNRIFNNELGVFAVMSEDNVISYNDIVGNNLHGAWHNTCMCGGEHNQFHHNNFIENNHDTLQASDIGGGIDYWYSVAYEEGNYWSDYTGPDSNGNGIGDIPYNIEGDESQDLYPLMERLVSTIAGNVSDGVNPIAGVYVQALGTDIDDYTDSDGMYSLAPLGAGIYDLSFSHDLHRDTIVLSVPATLDFTTALDVVMEPVTGIEENGISSPDKFTLFQNYPNPFNAITMIKFGLTQGRNVNLAVYDLLGQKIRTLVDGYRAAGIQMVMFDASDLPSGVYFYRLRAGDIVETRRMVLLK